ncbi:rho GTPase-activating protein 7 [Phtheirospermum japonicum]|uniref:Rho GTPase-activating protein 7 n=1 Tax=Phtheirospermum japonicum TaxID=374723 RepID=A0A830CCY9_9LAMI|nr:rho GTPase-activating protein 7 [Phtheirospermum japonicum]
MESQKLEVVRIHIQRYGLDASYDIWINHVEHLPEHEPGPSAIDFEMMDETRNVMADVHPDDEYGLEGPDEQYHNLYEAMNSKLYEGISSFSSLNFLVKLMNIKANNKWTNRSFNELLKLLKLAFPSMKLVNSHYESKKLFESLGLDYENIQIYCTPITLHNYRFFVDLGNLESVELHQANMPFNHVIETPGPSSSITTSYDMYSDDDDMEEDTIAEYENDKQHDPITSDDETNDDLQIYDTDIVLEFFPELLDMLRNEGYIMIEADAAIFLPCLIEKGERDAKLSLWLWDAQFCLHWKILMGARPF